MSNKIYIVHVVGYNDSTSVEIDLTEEEFKLIKRLSKMITEASEYGCMPRMKIKKKTHSGSKER